MGILIKNKTWGLKSKEITVVRENDAAHPLKLKSKISPKLTNRR